MLYFFRKNNLINFRPILIKINAIESWHQCKNMIILSSKASGGWGVVHPICMQYMENTTFVALLSLISALELKVAWASSFIGIPSSGDDLIFFLFSLPLNLDRKNAPILDEDLFF